MKEIKYKATKELSSTVKCWDKHETIPIGAICDIKYWKGSNTICFKNKLICDVDSEMAKEYFEKII